MGEEGCQLASDIVGFLGQVEMNESVQDLIADLLLFWEDQQSDLRQNGHCFFELQAVELYEKPDCLKDVGFLLGAQEQFYVVDRDID